MQELTFEQVEDVSGGDGFKLNFWQFIAENYITVMGDGECGCGGGLVYFAPYPGEGLPPFIRFNYGSFIFFIFVVGCIRKIF